MTRLGKALYLLKSERQTQRLLLYYIAINMLNILLNNYNVNSDDFYLTLFKINVAKF